MTNGKKPKRISPTALTLKYLRARNVPCKVTEKWVKTPQGGFRVDLWGGDLQALTHEHTINIQAGAATDRANKVKKALNLPEVREWLASPHRLFQIWTWKKRPAFKKDGSRKRRDEWSVRVDQIDMRDGELVVMDFNLSE